MALEIKAINSHFIIMMRRRILKIKFLKVNICGAEKLIRIAGNRNDLNSVFRVFPSRLKNGSMDRIKNGLSDRQISVSVSLPGCA